MGFGMILIGYFAVLGTMPSALIYGGYLMIVGAVASLFLVYGTKLLSQYNIYFKISFFIAAVYFVVLAVSVPFEMMKLDENITVVYQFASKIARFIVLFSFHNFFILAIRKLAESIGNIKVSKNAKRNLYINYVFFIFCAFAAIPAFSDETTILINFISMISGIIVFLLNFALFYSCYMRITYEGHDEEIDRKYEEIMSKKKKK